MPKKPNLVYVFADQLRHDALGCTGFARAATPNIDRFRAQSVDMTNTVSNTPVCTAYRASLMTGKHQSSTGMVINELRIHPNQRCFGHVLGDAGYRTGYIGKWHLFANELGNHHDPRNSFVPRGPHRLGWDREWAAYNFHHENYSPEAYYHTESPEKIFYPEGVYEPTAQTDLAIDFIRRAAPGDDPFAVVLSWGPPHLPWRPDNAPEQFWRMFRDEEFPLPPNYRPEDDPHTDRWQRFRSPEQRRELQDWQRNYHAQVASIDAEFGRLMAALEGAGVAEDTIVVFTSDHGEMFGAQGRHAKLTFYEEAARVPFFIRWPAGLASGRTIAAPFGAVDIFPTLAGLMGLEPPAGVDGHDLSDALRGEGEAPKASLLMCCGATAAWGDGYEWRAARAARYTYAIYLSDGSELFFDRETDPYQTTNLAGSPVHQPEMTRLRDWMHLEMARIKDEFRPNSWYEANWTDGNRCVIRSATAEFGPAVPV
jgi:arylsulfatase A-like enzyme